MPLGRNDPCHCGSGRKYKRCHEDSDREAARKPALQLVRGSPEPARTHHSSPPPETLSGPWEVDVVPMPGTIDNDPAARTVLVMLVVGGFVVSAQMENRPSEEPEALAELMAREIHAAIERTRFTPVRVAVRHGALAEPLERLLQPQGIAVALQSELPELDEAVRSLLGHLFHGIAARDKLRSQPETWAGWGLPPEEVSRFFAAAAEFHRAAPWNISAHERPIVVSRDGGPQWALVVLGGAGEQTGLSCYEQPADLAALFVAPDDPSQAFSELTGMVVSLLFNSRRELPKRMRDEIKANRWEVAAPDAYPTMLVINTPGGGIREQHFALLHDIVKSVPRFVALHADAFDVMGNEQDIVWTDPDTGLTCELAASESELLDDLAADLLLDPAGPEGDGATPGARIGYEQAQVMVGDTAVRYLRWLQDPPTGRGLGLTTARRHVDNAVMLLTFVAYGHERPITAITEFDLRAFLYDWYPRQTRNTSRSAGAVLGSLRRFLAFLESEFAVHCPWADDLLRDRDFFDERWRTRPLGPPGDRRDADWYELFTLHLMTRALVPMPGPDDEFEFNSPMGPVEHEQYIDLHNAWLDWRDQLIRSGVRELRSVIDALLERQRAWLETPMPRRKSLTPMAAITNERRATQRSKR